jgi:endonuclease/exonuclease/phosphatase family metal-dependent hydrolase
VDLRVASYNVKAFRLGFGEVVNLARALEADILLVQESGSRRTLRRLATALEMHRASDPISAFRRRVKDAVLVRPPWRIIGHRLHRFEASQRLYPRGALVAQVGRAGRRVWVVSTHFGLAPAERLDHSRALVELLAPLEAPLVLGGDFNETPDRKAVRRIGERYRDVWASGSRGAGATFPAADPSARIDYLFVSEDVRIGRVEVPVAARPASDHLPVVADLTIETG